MRKNRMRGKNGANWVCFNCLNLHFVFEKGRVDASQKLIAEKHINSVNLETGWFYRLDTRSYLHKTKKLHLYYSKPTN